MKPRERRDKALDMQDAANDALLRIEAMAGLFEAAAAGEDSELRGIGEAACIIGEETNKVRTALSSMRGLVGSGEAGGKL